MVQIGNMSVFNLEMTILSYLNHRYFFLSVWMSL